MGYYVNIEEANFRLPHEKLKEAHEALIALDITHHDEKRGGSWSGGKQTEKWFSWMPMDYATSLESAQQILEKLGFEIELDDEGNLMITNYDSKRGQEELFLSALAPFVNEGSYINWIGEDHQRWQNYFDGKKMIVKDGYVIYAEVQHEEA